MDDGHVEADFLAERGERVRSALTLVAERGFRRHHESGQVDMTTDPRYEFLVGGRPKLVVEVLDHGDLRAGGGETDQPLVGVAQQCRSQTQHDLLGMGVERDDRGPRIRSRRRVAELAHQVQVATMETVEDADRDVQTAHVLAQLVHSGNDFVRDSGAGVLQARLARAAQGLGDGHVICAGARSRNHEHLLGHDAPRPPRAHSHERPARVDQPDRGSLLGVGPFGRLHLLTSGRGHEFFIRQVRNRDGLQTDIDREHEAGKRGRAFGRRVPHDVEVAGRLQTERAAASSSQSAEIGPAPEPLAEVSGKGPDVRPRAALDFHNRGRPIGFRAVPFDQLEAVDRDRSGRQIDGLALTGQLVGPAAADLHGAESRRALLYRPAEPGECLQDGLPSGGRTASGRELPVSVVGGRARAEAHGRSIGLVVAHVVLDDSGPESQEDGQDAGSKRIECSAVADAVRAAQPANKTDHVVGRRTRRLREHEDAVDAALFRAAGSAHRGVVPPASTSSAARARTARRASASGRYTVAPAARACPPPPNVPVSTVASTPSRVRTLIRVSPAASLKRIAACASRAWASMSTSPSDSSELAPAAARSASSCSSSTIG